MSMFIFSSCNKAKEQSSNDYAENDTTYSEKSVLIDSVECTYQSQDGEFAKIIITSKMVSDTVFLRKVINKFKIKGEAVCFHIPDLLGNGEEYAFFSGDNIFVYKNPPKSIEDVVANKIIDNMATNIADLEALNMDKDLRYEGISRYLETINNAAVLCRDNKDNENARVKEQLNRLRSKLKSTQIAVFPRLRKLFANESKERLWEENITVTHSGRSIFFTGYMYASNKNIKASYEAISDLLYKLRFSKANFRWSESDGYTYYTINSPADAVILDN